MAESTVRIAIEQRVISDDFFPSIVVGLRAPDLNRNTPPLRELKAWIGAMTVPNFRSGIGLASVPGTWVLEAYMLSLISSVPVPSVWMRVDMNSLRASLRELSLVMPVIAAALSGCSHPTPPPKAPPQVSVVTLRTRPVTLTTELPGRTVAFRVAEVRPQVNGVILRRLFKEGSEVRAGQQLYQIDPAPFRASVASAEATLARDQATLTSAKLMAERYKPLAEAHAVSSQANDNAIAAEQQAVADIQSAQAGLDTARINLTYTRVLSPISGRTGRSSVTEGALVSANQTASLVIVQQLDPIYVDVNQPDSVLLQLKRALSEGRLQTGSDGQTQTHLSLEDGSHYDQVGKLEFGEETVDTGTGSITLRAIFPNPDKTLLPGMFVRERVQEGVNANGLLVPEQAVTHNQRGEPTALVVTADNKVHTQVVRTDRAMGDQWLITGGLAAGDRVIVRGLQQVTPGVTEVNPQEISEMDLNKSATTVAALH